MEKPLTKEKQIAILKGVRVLNKRGVKGKNDQTLLIGDLVFDEKNGEFGIFLGIKPLLEAGSPVINSLAKKSLLENIPIQTSPEPNTCIVMTLFEEKTGVMTARIRYTNSKFLFRVEKVHNEVQTLSDLETHCEYECFLECNSECSLWKYKTPGKA